jgi:hypothetical protein
MENAVDEADEKQQPDRPPILLDIGQRSGERAIELRLAQRDPGKERRQRPAESAGAVGRCNAERAHGGKRIVGKQESRKDR